MNKRIFNFPNKNSNMIFDPVNCTIEYHPHFREDYDYWIFKDDADNNSCYNAYSMLRETGNLLQCINYLKLKCYGPFKDINEAEKFNKSWKMCQSTMQDELKNTIGAIELTNKEEIPVKQTVE